jgi:predicted O-methyltransferase YrrM
MKSSYNNTNISYKEVFSIICQIYKPKTIVEFGILDGFSLKTFVENTDKDQTKIYAYDIFEKFNGNGANKENILTKFSQNQNITIDEADFYTKYKDFEPESIDLLHIDIANDGTVYQYVIDHYLPLVKGIIILEGGSEERDNVYWMKKYNKESIKETIDKIKKENPDLTINIIGSFPSITIISK